MAQSGTYEFPAVGGSHYVKLFDGTMIQWGIVSGTVSAGNAYADLTVQYPVAFHESSDICVLCSNSGLAGATSTQRNATIPIAFGMGSGGGEKLTQFGIRIWKQASVGTEGNPAPYISWLAIGRWKA